MRPLNTELKDFKFKMLLMRATEKMSRWVPAREDQTLWVLLEQAKRQEERTGDAKFICTVQVHPECACILAHPCQLEEVQPFCTNQKKFTIFGADPTFNIFTKNISYHHHIPQLKTGASWDWRKPCFHWPSTDASAQGSSHISQLCPCLGSENPNLECILACETDGEKPLYRFRRVLKYAVFLLCSLHFKQNKEGELKERGLPTSLQKEFLREIFGNQEGEVLYLCLIDHDSENNLTMQCRTWKSHGHTKRPLLRLPRVKIHFTNGSWSTRWSECGECGSWSNTVILGSHENVVR